MTGVLARLARGARRIGRAVRRGRVAPLALAALVGIVAVAVALGTRTGGSAPGGGVSTVRVGVSDGDSVPAYVAAQRSELARLVAQAPGTAVYALVAFDRYLSPGEVANVTGAGAGTRAGRPADARSSSVDEMATIAAYARAQVPGRQTELVRLPANRLPDDLVAGMAEVADRKSRQAASYTAAAGQDPASRALDESFAAVASQEAANYRATCACVYALLVRAAPAVLADIASRAGVRVVDAAPQLRDPAYGVFVAPLPEQVGTVGPLS